MAKSVHGNGAANKASLALRLKIAGFNNPDNMRNLDIKHAYELKTISQELTEKLNKCISTRIAQQTSAARTTSIKKAKKKVKAKKVTKSLVNKDSGEIVIVKTIKIQK